MIYSMTGYGRGSAVKNNFSAEIELKSVNSRFLEVFLKLPPSLVDRDYELREILKSKIQRGKVNGVIQLKTSARNELTKVNEERLRDYIEQIKKVKRAAHIEDELKLEHILSNRDIISSSDIELTDSEFEVVKRALKNTITDLLKMKKSEGVELSKDLKKRIKSIEQKVTSIENGFKKSVNSYYKKLQQRIKLLTKETEIDNQRLNLELAVIADKADLTEECVRLKSHLKFFIDSMNKHSQPGKKLNFLCQELNREANTISSKAVATSITHKAVLIKEEIEKIREQIQNIE
ncbi:MAG: YicC family protein [Ignavibacterium sp.]|nr:MAG: YicC family protein [Ignavibacterium sp.]